MNFCTVACKAVSMQGLGKHVAAAMDTHATIEVSLQTVLSIRSVQRAYLGGQLKQD
jgi:hypothetical protein